MKTVLYLRVLIFETCCQILCLYFCYQTMQLWLQHHFLLLRKWRDSACFMLIRLSRLLQKPEVMPPFLFICEFVDKSWLVCRESLPNVTQLSCPVLNAELGDWHYLIFVRDHHNSISAGVDTWILGIFSRYLRIGGSKFFVMSAWNLCDFSFRFQQLLNSDIYLH